MEPYLGEIRMFGGSYAPAGWALCDGSLVPIAENDALFTLIGTTYGGDGVTNFALPDLQGRVLVHQGQNPQTQTTFSLGQKGGSEEVTLNTEQMPAHTHAVSAQTAGGEIDTPDQGYFAQTQQLYSSSAPSARMNAALVAPAGGSQPHENMMPFLTVNFIIATSGIFPSAS